MSPLRPFFSYYGSRWTLTSRGAYPAPRYDRIIEPFAGGAGYSLHWPEREVILWEIDPVVAGIWRWLVAVDPEEVRALPLLAPTPEQPHLADLPAPARDLIGFWMGRCRAAPGRTASAWCRSGRWPSSFWSATTRERIAQQVGRIRHWQVNEGDYRAAGDVEATWFIDPPFSGRPGRHYRTRGSLHLDYESLADWSWRRRGQVIACENEGATWLPFRPIGSQKSFLKGSCREVAWLRR